MSKTVVGLFNSMSEAERVKQDLISDGYESSEISVLANDSSTSSTSERSADSDGSTSGEGIGARIEHFFSSLMGGDDDVHDHYAAGVNQGGALLAVRTDDADSEEVAQWLQEHGARNIDRGARSLKDNDAKYSGKTETPRQDAYGDTSRERNSKTLPVIEEELNVGKRAVDRGGVRVYSHTTEQPAEANVTLRDEKINVERRAVNRPATAADFAAGAGQVVEMRAQGEEAVVGKNARVVEEIVLGKQVSEHTESVHDKVRKTDVDVEEIDGNSSKDAEYATGRKRDRI